MLDTEAETLAMLVRGREDEKDINLAITRKLASANSGKNNI